jgi:hypothetical protein
MVSVMTIPAEPVSLGADYSPVGSLRHNARSNSYVPLYLFEKNGGRDRTRTCDLLRVKQAL